MLACGGYEYPSLFGAGLVSVGLKDGTDVLEGPKDVRLSVCRAERGRTLEIREIRRDSGWGAVKRTKEKLKKLSEVRQGITTSLR